MIWLDRLRMRSRGLSGETEARVLGWLQQAAPNKQDPLREAEFVVVDTETSGLDPHRDALLSIGAVRVRACRLHFSESFDRRLKQVSPSSVQNILIHGITGTEQLQGDDPTEVLTAFLEFAGKAQLVGFHAEFDRTVLDRALRDKLGIRLSSTWIDLAEILPEQFDRNDHGSLDDWLQHFGIEAPARHHALGDAAATAALLLVLLQKLATRGTTNTLAQLRQLSGRTHWLPSN